MEHPPLRTATGWQRQDSRPPDWQGRPVVPPAGGGGTGLRAPGAFDRFRGPIARGGRVDNTAAFLREMDQLRKLVADDSWMDALSREELIQIRDRARLVAKNLTRVQDQLKPFQQR